MTYRITGLSPAPFAHLFGLPDEELANHGALRLAVDAKPGFPDRIELRDLEPGETALLVNYTHQPATNPYGSRHAIFVREGAIQPYDRIDTVPEVMLIRTMSLRSFDEHDMMIDADLAEGDGVATLIERLFDDPAAKYIHAHNARRGCYSARIDRA